MGNDVSCCRRGADRITVGTITKKQAQAYQTLGLPYDASQAQLRKKFRKLAKEWHPDKNPSAEAARKFSRMSAAYNLLRKLSVQESIIDGAEAVSSTREEEMTAGEREAKAAQLAAAAAADAAAARRRLDLAKEDEMRARAAVVAADSAGGADEHHWDRASDATRARIEAEESSRAANVAAAHAEVAAIRARREAQKDNEAARGSADSVFSPTARSRTRGSGGASEVKGAL
jgi:curved DNA-binding protein CbpA